MCVPLVTGSVRSYKTHRCGDDSCARALNSRPGRKQGTVARLASRIDGRRQLGRGLRPEQSSYRVRKPEAYLYVGLLPSGHSCQGGIRDADVEQLVLGGNGCYICSWVHRHIRLPLEQSLALVRNQLEGS